MKTNRIPKNYYGIKTDTLKKVKLPSERAAREHYQIVKKRLMDVNNWHALTGAATGIFTVTDALGNIVTRVPKPDDYFKIELPAPENSSGSGFDWVRVVSVDEENKPHFQQISIQVKPAANPLENTNETAHFFNARASSTFVARREMNYVYAEVHGRNEEPNTSVPALKKLFRNLLVSIGAILGLSKFQWKKLVNGLNKLS